VRHSAGQAAVFLAANDQTEFYMLVRLTDCQTMSRYLIRRIEETPNIESYQGQEPDAPRM